MQNCEKRVFKYPFELQKKSPKCCFAVSTHPKMTILETAALYLDILRGISYNNEASQAKSNHGKMVELV